MGTMVLLPAAAGTPVRALDASGALVAALCGDEVVTGALREPDSWAVLCPGAVGVVVRGDTVFTGRERSVAAVDAATGRRVAECGPTDGPLTGFAVSADGAHVALGEHRVASVWEVGSGRRLARRRAHGGTIAHLGFSPGGDELVTRRDDEFAVWSWRSSLRRPRRRGTIDGYGSGFAVLPDGRLAGALGRDRLGVWTPGARLERSLQTDDLVRHVAAAPDGGRIAARLSEGGVVVWSWPDAERIAEHDGALLARCVAFGGEVLVAGDDAALMTWGDGVPAPAPERFVPAFEPRLADEAPASALDWERLTPDAVEAAARAIPWLERTVDREAPEAEDRAGTALHVLEASFERPAVRAIRGLDRPDVAARAEAVAAVVRERARRAPTAYALEAAFVAELVTSYAGLGWPVPADLRVLWSWYEAGRRPGAVRNGRLEVY